jgi:hypothetical protein
VPGGPITNAPMFDALRTKVLSDLMALVIAPKSFGFRVLVSWCFHTCLTSDRQNIGNPLRTPTGL